MITFETKRALCEKSLERCRGKAPVTLDGEPAIIAGMFLNYALVRRADGKGGNVEYSWPAVSRVMAKGGHFKS